jgi:hypothetical protein
MKVKYEKWNPSSKSASLVRTAENICDEYAQQGYELTLRQLYYQFVARDIIANTQACYDNLGALINRARLAGMIDWDHLVDRTRNLEHNAHWSSPASLLRAAANGYAIDKWETQDYRVEVWVEKEALAGIVERAADDLDVAWFACRGYVSQSEMWSAAQRLGSYIRNSDQRVIILHLGDHDPSGIDMSRDIEDRLRKFIEIDWFVSENGDIDDATDIDEARTDAQHEMTSRLDDDYLTVKRIALNRDQIDLYQPPPNPAKMTDSRADSYVREHGRQSWELDALSPAVLDRLIRDEVTEVCDMQRYTRLQLTEENHRTRLLQVANQWRDA